MVVEEADREVPRSDLLRAARRRIVRSRIRLGAAAAAELVTVGLLAALLASGVPASPVLWGVAAALGVAPLVAVAAVRSWRPHRRRPASWPSRGLAIGIPQGCGLGIALDAWEPSGANLPAIAAMVPIVLVLLGATCSYLAARALRHPLGPELGLLDIDVSTRIRSSRPGLPTPALERVDLREDRVVVTIQTGPMTIYQALIEMSDVIDVRVRPSRRGDNPWITVGEHGCHAHDGDVLVLGLRSGQQVLPVVDAAGFATVLDARLSELGRRSAGGTDAPLGADLRVCP
ncbi:hypothetical protein WEH80_34030 [Actinomycetes bacterium KLBMP 9759]